MSAYELAKKYYPRLWDKARLAALVYAGKLTEMEYQELTGPDNGVYSPSEYPDNWEMVKEETAV